MLTLMNTSKSSTSITALTESILSVIKKTEISGYEIKIFGVQVCLHAPSDLPSQFVFWRMETLQFLSFFRNAKILRV